MDNIKKLSELIASSSRIVFFGGAGVSTESGIPDFRSKDGLYSQRYKYPPEQILSHEFFFAEPEEFYEFYRAKLLAPGILPNKAHYALAELEKEGKLSGIVTQNIDGLHQQAGSKRVYELHGSVKRNRCLKCGKFFGDEHISATNGVPKCECSGIIKPDVVLYGEQLDGETVRGAVEIISRADLLIVAGTSLTVYPAAGLIEYYRGKEIVLINRDATPLDSRAGLVIREPVGETLSKALQFR